MRKVKPDVLLFAGTAADLRDLLPLLGQPGLAVLCGEDGLSGLGSGATSNPVFGVSAYASDVDTPEAKAFREQYRKTFSEEPDVHAALAYDSARLIFEALRQAGENHGARELQEKLAALKDFPGLTSSLSFGTERQVHRPAFVVRLENGQAHMLRRFEPQP